MAPIHGFYPLSAIGKAKSWHVKDTNDLLSEKLLDGYSLANAFCPHCVMTPLVQRQAHTMIGSFKALPVAGVAFCVSCNEHVVANDCDTFTRCNSLKEKGDTETLDSMLDSLQKCAQRRQNIIDAFEEDRQDLVCTEAPDRPSDKSGKPCARDKVEHTMESDATPLPEVNTSFTKPLSPTGQIYSSPNDVKQKDDPLLSKEAGIQHNPSEHAHKSASPGETGKQIRTQSSIKGAEKGSRDSTRCNIASQVLTSKTLQGYSLMEETPCLKCGMPLMKYADQIECVVCPVLAKKIIEDVKEKILAEKKAIIKQKAAAQRKAEQEAVALASSQEHEAAAKIEAEEDEAVASAPEETPLRQPNGEEEIVTTYSKKPIEEAVGQATAQGNEATAEIDAEEDEAVATAPEEAPIRQPNGDEEIDTTDSKTPIDAARSPYSAAAVSACSETTNIMPLSPASAPVITPVPVDERLVSLPDEKEPEAILADEIEEIETAIRIMLLSSETAPTIAPIPSDETLSSFTNKRETEVSLDDNGEGTEIRLRQHMQEQDSAQTDAEEYEAAARALGETPLRQPNSKEEINPTSKKPIEEAVALATAQGNEAAAKIDAEEDEAVACAPEETPLRQPNGEEEIDTTDSKKLAAAQDNEGIAEIDAEEDKAAAWAPEEAPLCQPNGEKEIDTTDSKKPIDAARSPYSAAAVSACIETTNIMPLSPESAPVIPNMPVDERLVSLPDEEEPEAILADEMEEIEITLLSSESSPTITPIPSDETLSSLTNKPETEVSLDDNGEGTEISLRQHMQEQAVKMEGEEDEAAATASGETTLRQPNSEEEVNTTDSKMPIEEAVALATAQENEAAAKIDAEEDEAVASAPEETPLRQPNGEEEIDTTDSKKPIEEAVGQATAQDNEATADIDAEEDEAVLTATEEAPIRQPNGDEEIDTADSKKPTDAARSPYSAAAVFACSETTNIIPLSPESAPVITNMPVDERLVPLPDEEEPEAILADEMEEIEITLLSSESSPTITPIPSDESLSSFTNKQQPEVSLDDNGEETEIRLRKHMQEQDSTKMDGEEYEAAARASGETPVRQPNSEEEISTTDSKKPIEEAVALATAQGNEAAAKIDAEEDEAVASAPEETPLRQPNSEEEIDTTDFKKASEEAVGQATAQDNEATAEIDAEEDEAAAWAPEATPLRQPNGDEEIDTTDSKKPIDATRSPYSAAAVSACSETTNIMPLSPESAPVITPVPVNERLVSLPDEEEPEAILADEMEEIEITLLSSESSPTITPIPSDETLSSFTNKPETEVSLDDNGEGTEISLRQHMQEQAVKMEAEEYEAAATASGETPLRQPNSEEEVNTTDSEKPIEEAVALATAQEHEAAAKIDAEEDEAAARASEETPLRGEEEIDTTDSKKPIEEATALAVAQDIEAAAEIDAEEDEAVARASEEAPLRQPNVEEAIKTTNSKHLVDAAEAAPKIKAEEAEAVERAQETVPQPNGKEKIDKIVSGMPIDSPSLPSSMAAASVSRETTHTSIMPSSPETISTITLIDADQPLVSPEVMLDEDMDGIELSLSEHILTMKTLGETAAQMAILPPKPVDCDLLDPLETEDWGEKNVESDEVLQEYCIRREIASNLYGIKFLQGYSLLDEAPCLKCGMPLMKNSTQVDCVVCPVLAKKRKEEEEEEKKLTEQNARIEAEAALQKKAEEESVMMAKVEEEKAPLEVAEVTAQEEAAAKARVSDQEAAAMTAAREDTGRREAEKAAMRADSEKEAAKMIQAKVRAMLEAKTAEKYAASLVEVEAFRMEEEARINEEERLLQEALKTEEDRVTKAASDGNRLSTDEICSFMSSLH